MVNQWRGTVFPSIFLIYRLDVRQMAVWLRSSAPAARDPASRLGCQA